MKASALLPLLKQTLKEWNEDKVPRLGAALAYYSVFSVGPLLLVAIAIAGLAFGAEATRAQIVSTIGGLVGPEGAEAIDALLAGAAKPQTGILATVIGIVALLFGAMGVFVQLKDALNTIWEVEPRKADGWKAGLRRFITKYVGPFGLVFSIGFLLMVSLLVSAGIAAAGAYFEHLVPGVAPLWQAVNFLLTLGVVTVAFALIFRFLPDVQVRWGDVWVGAFGTALLFTVGQILMGLYLGRRGLGDTYGAAGSIVVFLLWMYYSAQIALLGAEFTQVYANTYGSHLKPDKDAVAFAEESPDEPRVDHNPDRRPGSGGTRTG